MRNKCLLGLGLVFVISLTSMVAFAFSFTGTPADEVDETERIVRAVVSEESDAMPTTEPITTTRQEQEMVKKSSPKSAVWIGIRMMRIGLPRLQWLKLNRRTPREKPS